MLWETMAEELGRYPCKGLKGFFEFDYEGNPSEPDLEVLQKWKRWVKEVFQPLDAERESIVLHKFHLAADPDSAGDSLARLVAHIAEFRGVVRGWENQQSGEETLAAWRNGEKYAFIPHNDFPSGFGDYLRVSYGNLKTQQERLYAQLNQS